MKHSKSLLALLLAISLSPCAKADVISLGTVGATNYLLGFVGPMGFTDLYQFTLTGASNITDAFGVFLPAVLPIDNFNFNLVDVTTPSHTFTADQTSYSGLTADTYDFKFTGFVPGPAPSVGIYFGDYTVASAVPELDVWMMFLIGAGLLVYQLRRRQNALRHSELAGT